MTIEVSALRSGDVIHYRCGGTGIIASVERCGSTYRVWLKDRGRCEVYRGTGYHNSTNLLDILKVDNLTFDWTRVVAGMAFSSKAYDDILTFIGYTISGNALLQRGEYNNYASYDLKAVDDGHLKREPAHDRN